MNLGRALSITMFVLWAFGAAAMFAGFQRTGALLFVAAFLTMWMPLFVMVFSDARKLMREHRDRPRAWVYCRGSRSRAL